jgi:hypothetical protein
VLYRHRSGSTWKTSIGKRKHEAAIAVEALDPGVPYESRWAPYVRVHGPGQGQFPKGSIRPRGYMAPDARRSLAGINVTTKRRNRQRPHRPGRPVFRTVRQPATLPATNASVCAQSETRRRSLYELFGAPGVRRSVLAQRRRPLVLDDRSHQGAATGAEPQPAQWRNRIEYDTADLRVFANLDASLSALNPRDIFT